MKPAKKTKRATRSTAVVSGVLLSKSTRQGNKEEHKGNTRGYKGTRRNARNTQGGTGEHKATQSNTRKHT